MKQKTPIKKTLSIFIMPLSLVLAMAIMYLVKQVTGIVYYDLAYDFRQFYVFSAPTILFFSGVLAVPRLWDRENKKQSRRLLEVSFVLCTAVTLGITVTRDFWDDIYLINPFESMSIDGLISVLGSEYAIFLPIYILWSLAMVCVIIVAPALLGGYLFETKKKAIKIPALLAIIATLVAVGTYGIVDYKSSRIFYDVNGNAYNNHFDVLYFDESGRSYQITEIPEYYFDWQANNITVKSDDREYLLGECFVSEETGLLVTDEKGEIIVPLGEKDMNEKSEKGYNDEGYIFKYVDRQGNEYRALSRAVYNKNGKLNKRFRYLTTDSFTSLRDDTNADYGYYYYDLKGNRYVKGQYIMYYDADGNIYKRKNADNFAAYNCDYDVYNPDGKLIDTVDGWDCVVDSETGYVLREDKIKRDYDRDCDEGFYDTNGKKYYMLSDAVYDENGNVSYDNYILRMDSITW